MKTKFNPFVLTIISLLIIGLFILLAFSTFVLKNYFLVLAILFLVLYVLIKMNNQFRPLKIEAFAVLSFLAFILNYLILELFLGFLRLLSISRGGSELYSFLGGCLAVFLGHLALFKIVRNKYKGKMLAITGIIGGYIFMFFWISFSIRFVIAMNPF